MLHRVRLSTLNPQPVGPAAAARSVARPTVRSGRGLLAHRRASGAPSRGRTQGAQLWMRTITVPPGWPRETDLAAGRCLKADARPTPGPVRAMAAWGHEPAPSR